MEQQFQDDPRPGISGRPEPEVSGGSRGPAVAAAPGSAAIERGADLLVRVLEASEPVAVTELASSAGLPKSTASRLLTALERHGLVEQDGERGRLRPGPAILRVAERGMLERNVVELARPSLDALSDSSGETINLAVPGAAGVEHLLQVDGRHFLGTGQWVGRAVDYHCTANGKVFLAFGRALAPAEERPLTAHTTETITDPSRLRAELEAVRRAGFASAIDELEVGLAAIATPVRGASGEVVAALSISGPTVRMTSQRIAELRSAMIVESCRLSARLGYTEEGTDAA